jgi:hypothetical protein
MPVIRIFMMRLQGARVGLACAASAVDLSAVLDELGDLVADPLDVAVDHVVSLVAGAR